MKNKSIRYYFITTMAAVLVASTLVMGFIQAYIATAYFRQEKEALLSQITASLAQGVRSGQLPPVAETDDSTHYISDITGTVVIITGLDGRVRFASGEGAPTGEAAAEAAYLADVDKGGAGGYNNVGRVGGLLEGRYYSNGRAVLNAGGAPIGYVFAAADASQQQVYLADSVAAILLSAALALLLASLLALGLTHRTVLPIRRLSEAAQRFAEGDYSARVPVRGNDELAKLSVTFNNMADVFQATDASRRSFMGNIAHELRTPMTSIKGFIDGMLDGTIPPAQREHYLAVVSDEAGRLARLTKNMLDISQLEAGEYVPTLSVFDMWLPLTAVLLGAEQRLSDSKIRLEGLEHGQPAFVEADEDFVHQILYNLVDNAIKFAGEEGIISVNITVAKGLVTTAIRNTGAGIPADMLPRVFDRFYKADMSRSAAVGGSGLGLYICKVLLGLMGGRIWADSKKDEWTEFSFSLPAAAKRGRSAETKKPPGKE